MSKYKVVLTDYEFADLRFEEKVFAESQLEIEFVKGQCRTEEEVIALAKDADAILNQYAPLSARVVGELAGCKVISRYGVGVNTIDLDAATAKGICVANVPDYGVEEVSNHALALLLAWSRKVVLLNQHVKKGVWDFKLGVPIRRFTEQTLGVIGFGRIPRRFVQKVKPMGFRILVHDPYVPEDQIAEAGAEPVSLETLLRASDFVSIHVPLTKETKHLLDREKLGLMKRNAVIINTARGPIIKEEDLVEALRDGRIAGAALDVVEEEPIPPDHPFLAMDQVILTPHSAWYSEEAMAELRTKAALNVVEVLKGNLPLYLVNEEVKGRLSL